MQDCKCSTGIAPVLVLVWSTMVLRLLCFGFRVVTFGLLEQILWIALGAIELFLQHEDYFLTGGLWELEVGFFSDRDEEG